MAEINSKIEQLFSAFSQKTSLMSSSPTTITQCLPTTSTDPLSSPSSLLYSATTLKSHQQPQHHPETDNHHQVRHDIKLQHHVNNSILSFIDQSRSSPYAIITNNNDNVNYGQNCNNKTIAAPRLLEEESQRDSPLLLETLLPKPEFRESISAELLSSLFGNNPQQQSVISSTVSKSSLDNNSQINMPTTAKTLESIENNHHLVNNPFISSSSLSKPETTMMTTKLTDSIAIPMAQNMDNINYNNDNISGCLKSFLDKQNINLCGEDSSSSSSMKNNPNGEYGSNCIENHLCSSLSSSSSSDGSQYSPPSTLVNDIVQETVMFEHTEDFIKSLKIPLEVLDDLASRFVLNMPQEEKYDPIRICFQCENAFWHYLDFYCQCDSKLPKFKFKRFAQIMFTYVPRFRQYLDIFDDVVNKWVQYKFSIPCSGAIMLDETMDYVLLVQGYGNKTWGFPKGKVNHDESLMNCAVREVFEETGYNCMSNIFETQYLERKIFESRLRLFLIKNVDFNFDFKPQARNEIRAIKWFALKEFPIQQQDQQKKSVMAAAPNQNGNTMMPHNASKFCSVIPFIMAIRKWVENEKRKAKVAKKRERKHQNMMAKQQQKLPENIIEGKNYLGMNPPESISSSPSTVEDDCNQSTIQYDNNVAANSTKSTSCFVDVDLQTILGYKEMYNVKNDNRELLTREEMHENACLESDKKSFQTTWNNLVNDYNANNDLQNETFNLNITGVGGNTNIGGAFAQTNSNDSVKNCKINPLPQAGTVEDIERAMIESVKNDNGNSEFSGSPDLSTLLLGTKGSCNEKLNLLFGLAQTNTVGVDSVGNDPKILTSNTSSSSPLPKNGFAMISNHQQSKKSVSPELKPQATRKMDPIGTKRNSTNFSNNNVEQRLHQDNLVVDQKQRSGQTVISNNTNSTNNSNNNDINRRQKMITPTKNNDSKKSFLNGGSSSSRSDGKQQETPTKRKQQQRSKNTIESPSLLLNVNDVEDVHKQKVKNYNGLAEETIVNVHPKIELLLQRLKAINNTAA